MLLTRKLPTDEQWQMNALFFRNMKKTTDHVIAQNMYRIRGLFHCGMSCTNKDHPTLHTFDPQALDCLDSLAFAMLPSYGGRIGFAIGST